MQFPGGGSSGSSGSIVPDGPTQTNNYVVQTSDMFTDIPMVSAANRTVIIPANLAVDEGSWFLVSADNTGIVTMAHASGATHLLSPYSKVQIATQYGIIGCLYRGTVLGVADCWQIFGDLA